MCHSVDRTTGRVYRDTHVGVEEGNAIMGAIKSALHDHPDRINALSIYKRVVGALSTVRCPEANGKYQ